MYSKQGPNHQQIPVPLSAEDTIYTQRLRDAFRISPRKSLFMHDATYDHCNYAAIEKQLAKAIGPRAPKRKRRKRLAKKIAKRGGMAKTRGVVQSYFDAWPAMRMYFTPRREDKRWLPL